MKKISSIIIIIFAFVLLILGQATRMNMLTRSGIYSSENIILAIIVLAVIVPICIFLYRNDDKSD
jgi:predicted Co/Zn/Cd cation transporter (cation efflux family)